VVQTLDKLEAERTYDGRDILFGKKKGKEEEQEKKPKSLLVGACPL